MVEKISKPFHELFVTEVKNDRQKKKAIYRGTSYSSAPKGKLQHQGFKILFLSPKKDILDPS